MHLSMDKCTVWNATESCASMAKASFHQGNAKLITMCGWFSTKFCVVFRNKFYNVFYHLRELTDMTKRQTRSQELEYLSRWEFRSDQQFPQMEMHQLYSSNCI